MSVSMPGVSLKWLFDGIADLPATDIRVEDLTLDSRTARPGSLFLAVHGTRAHGLNFAADAVARGATVVLWEPVADAGAAAGADASAAAGADASVAAGAATGVAMGGAPPFSAAAVYAAEVPGLGRLVGRIADRFFQYPSTQLRITGITGTNGKTTCAYLLAQCLERLNIDSAYIGTLGWGRIAALAPATHTTPDVITVHRMLARLRAAGVHDVIMEVSSHALDQGRVDAVRFHAAAFTNLSRDHLDYHVSMQAYADAKARLLVMPDLEHLIINVGDAFGREWARGYRGAVPLTEVWVGADDAGTPARAARRVHARDVRVDLRGISLSIGGSFGERELTTKLLGRFNAENSVVVLGALSALGVPLAAAADALSGCHAAPGRMQVIEAGAPEKPLAVVDYAHTPDALAKALSALREHCRGALWCVFGCGGDRDAGKRPLMGAIADELADEIIVTDDNPRSEPPEAITQGILRGITAHGVRVIHDRGSAIATALREAVAADAVLIAGKGHEDHQIYGETRRAFSDAREARRHLGAAA